MDRDHLGDLDTCRQCGAAVRMCYVDEYRMWLPFDPPRPSHTVPLDAFARHWRDTVAGGYFTIRVANDTDQPTYVAHLCGVNRKRGPRMSDPFGTPKTPGDGVGTKELEGKLLLLTVHEIKHDVQTAYGLGNCANGAAVDLADLTEYPDVTLWGVISASFDAGKKYYGRIGRGVAQPGKSAPWIWSVGSDEDKELAKTYLEKFAAGSIGTSTPAPEAPASAPASAPAAAPPWAT